MNHEIKKKTKLLTTSGHLREPGYAKKMNFIYNRECVKGFPLKLKEWNFYQFIKDHYAIQLTLGHVSYMGQMAVGIIDLDTGKRWDFGTMKPLYVPKLDLNPEQPSVCEYKGDNCHLKFHVTDTKRILSFKGQNEQYSTIEIKLVITNDMDNEKLVIATPFAKSTQFYLNYKENYYQVSGYAHFGSDSFDFDGATGLIDWGRGVWPYAHEWYWGNLTSHIDSIPFGFNIGWGFGDTSRATENIYFYNKKGYKLGKLITEWEQNDLMKVQRIYDTDGTFDCTFTPLYNNHTQNKYVVVDTECDQVYGYFSGSIQTEDGVKEFKDVLAFVEHAVNHW